MEWLAFLFAARLFAAALPAFSRQSKWRISIFGSRGISSQLCSRTTAVGIRALRAGVYVSTLLSVPNSFFAASLWVRYNLFLSLFHRHLRFFLAVLADFLNAAAVGAPGEPGLRIFSPDPEAMRLRLAWMFA